jgi:HK97 family phage prohead protease
MEKELRSFPSDLKVEKREDGRRTISGYAAVFNCDSQDLGGFVERISPGAFKEALKTSDTRALFNHDANFVLGRKSAGTLRLKEDERGLFMEIDPPQTQAAKDLMESIKRGDISEQSFAFSVQDDKWSNMDDPDKMTVRTVEKISHLFDVSPVTYPAYQDTSVALRRLDAEKNTEADDGLLDDLLIEDDFDSVLADL